VEGKGDLEEESQGSGKSTGEPTTPSQFGVPQWTVEKASRQTVTHLPRAQFLRLAANLFKPQLALKVTPLCQLARESSKVRVAAPICCRLISSHAPPVC
jgi:hypothetical protein